MDFAHTRSAPVTRDEWIAAYDSCGRHDIADAMRRGDRLDRPFTDEELAAEKRSDARQAGNQMSNGMPHAYGPRGRF